MKSAMMACGIVALGLSVGVSAQDSKVKSTTQIKADDARTVTMSGCLVPNGSGGFTLQGSVAEAGQGLKVTREVKTDVDGDETKVTSTTATKVDKGDKKSVGTSGSLDRFEVSARDGVDLAAHVGHQVKIAAVMVDPKKKGDDDAKIKIEETTKLEAENSPDGKAKSTTKLELPRGDSARLIAVAIQQVGDICSPQ